MEKATGKAIEKAMQKETGKAIGRAVQKALEKAAEKFDGEKFSAERITEQLEGSGMAVLETRRPEETFALGKCLGETAQGGQVWVLTGDLGAGKTVFTQGFAAGLGVEGPVNSPTFTILQIYEGGRLPLYHFDVYRIADVEEMEEIGYEECFYGEGVSLIEWGGLIEELLPERYVRITMEKDPEQGFDYRRITLQRMG